jgi:hypothetical protein
MSIVTFDRMPRPTADKRPAAKQPGFWARFYARMIEGRQRAAMKEIYRHRFLLPNDHAAWRLNERGEDSLPFGR